MRALLFKPDRPFNERLLVPLRAARAGTAAGAAVGVVDATSGGQQQQQLQLRRPGSSSSRAIGQSGASTVSVGEVVNDNNGGGGGGGGGGGDGGGGGGGAEGGEDAAPHLALSAPSLTMAGQWVHFAPVSRSDIAANDLRKQAAAEAAEVAAAAAAAAAISYSGEPFDARPNHLRNCTCERCRAARKSKTQGPEAVHFKMIGDIKLVVDTLEINGLVRTGHGKKAALIWSSQHLKGYFFKGLGPGQKINLFPHSWECTRKDDMARNINRMSQLHGRRHFAFMPECYIYPLERDAVLRALAAADAYWIVKPAGSSQGKGIRIISDRSQLPLERTKTDDNWIVERYIHNPLLLHNGRKFDLRLYVAVTSFDPLKIYIHREGLVRFATERYVADDFTNQFVHLTNYSINKHHPSEQLADQDLTFTDSAPLLSPLSMGSISPMRMSSSLPAFPTAQASELQSVRLDEYMTASYVSSPSEDGLSKLYFEGDSFATEPPSGMSEVAERLTFTSPSKRPTSSSSINFAASPRPDQPTAIDPEELPNKTRKVEDPSSHDASSWNFPQPGAESARQAHGQAQGRAQSRAQSRARSRARNRARDSGEEKSFSSGVDRTRLKWRLADFNLELERMNIDTDELWSRIHDAIIKTLISAEAKIHSSLNLFTKVPDCCFELFGFDILIDDKLDPWLMEVNFSPSMNTDSDLDLSIKSAVLADLFNLVGVRPPSTASASSAASTMVPQASFTTPFPEIQGNETALPLADLTSLPFELSKSDRRLLADFQREVRRSQRGNFRLIFPRDNALEYKAFFEEEREANMLLGQYMFVSARQGRPAHDSTDSDPRRSSDPISGTRRTVSKVKARLLEAREEDLRGKLARAMRGRVG